MARILEEASAPPTKRPSRTLSREKNSDLEAPLRSPVVRTRSGDFSPIPSQNGNGFHMSPPMKTRISSDKSSPLKRVRWILFGIMIGSTATAFLQSICINLPFEGYGSYGGSRIGSAPPQWEMPQERMEPKIHNTKGHTRLEIISENVSQALLNTSSIAGRVIVSTVSGNVTNMAGSKMKSTTSESTKVKIESTALAPFVNLPPPPKLGPNDAFSACLLIKDDNHWLIEWLAYHYQVMPLRHLIVVVDPESKTSPHQIFQRWRSRGLMDIQVWNDVDFLPKKINAKPHMFQNNTGLMMHRVRQNNFYMKCIASLRQNNHEWVMLVDTDEFVVPSYASRHFRNLTSQVDFRKGGSVLKLLKYYEQVAHANHTCLYMPRFFFGAKESRAALVGSNVPKSLNATHLMTQRYLWRHPRRNHNGKNLINTFRVQELKKFTSVHHVAADCPDPDIERTLDQSQHALVRVHHYLGSKEQYLFRDDPRFNGTTVKPTRKKGLLYEARGSKRYDELNVGANHEDHAARAWIKGFIKEMGEKMAVNLLEGVGIAGYE